MALSQILGLVVRLGIFHNFGRSRTFLISDRKTGEEKILKGN